ncbi:MAG: peptidylprolyl isomerase [Bacteroidales bacterium]|nr:peptidylprolyl isomerase [Bacteroidales bacterium]
MYTKLLICFMLLGACTLTNAQKETPLLKIGNKTTSLEEFEFIYKKNNDVAQVALPRNEYYDLFVNYKLKVAEAIALGLDTTKEYKDDCEHYLNEIAKPYLTDTNAVNVAKAELKARFDEEIDASHILVRLDENATPEDTLNAYLRIADARRRIIDGETFETVAMQCSDDPSVANNQGRLGYFSALQMVTPFEDAAYNTPVGKVSDIFRTQFGYHFLKVHDRRPFSGEVHVAHIMKQIPRNASKEAIEKIEKQTDSIYNRILQGDDFGDLARRFSDDRQSAVNGGEMQWFAANQIIEEFSSVAFALEQNGQVSKPFRSPFGMHIIKRIDKRDKRSEREVNSLIDRAMRGGHPIAQIGRKTKAHQLMKEYGLNWNADVRSQIETIILSNEPDTTKSRKLNEITTPLATFGTDGQLTTELLARRLRVWNHAATPSENFDRYAVEEILKYEKNHLAQKYPAFRYTMQEYYDGLLVFEINQKTIWNETDIDSTELAELYNANKARYSSGGTFDGNIYFCNDTKTAKELAKQLKNNKIKPNGKKLFKTVSGHQTQGGIYDDIIWPNIQSDYVVLDGKTTNGEPIPFEQIKGQLISDLQQRTEAKWVADLKKKYQPKTISKNKAKK